MTPQQPPVIGITTYGRNDADEFHLFASYTDAVRRAGGLPILLPPGEVHQEQILQLVDGLIFTGGGDIDPGHYSGQHHPTIYKLDAERDRFELSLARLALQQDVAILGICRGLQVLSVVSGSPLLPHVPDVFGLAVAHREEPRQPTQHAVQVVPGSRLADVVTVAEMEVVSWHHQAVPVAPQGWRVSALAADGLIEALEHEAHPWAIALQWHPEMSAAHDPLQQQIFRAFVLAAQARQMAGANPAAVC